jgi:hypothetical protein
VRTPRPALAALVAILLLAACGDDSNRPSFAEDTIQPTMPTTPDPAEVLESCVPAPSEDFVAIERHLTNGAQHLGDGFAEDRPDGHYVIADVYAVDDQLLASGLVWRLDALGGAPRSATPETSEYDDLPDAPDAAVPNALRDCLAAAKAAG